MYIIKSMIEQWAGIKLWRYDNFKKKYQRFMPLPYYSCTSEISYFEMSEHNTTISPTDHILL